MPEIQLTAYEKRTTRQTTKQSEGLNRVIRTAALGLFGIPIAAAMPYSGLAPFGLSFLSRERKFSLNAIRTFIFVSVGSIIACDRINAAKYIGAGILYLTALFVLEKGIKISDSAAAVAAGVSLIPAGLIALCVQSFTFGGVFLLLCEASAAAAGSFVIDKGLKIFQKKFSTSDLSTDDRIGLTATAVIAVMGLKSVYIGSEFSVMNTAASVAVMLTSASCGMGFATASGVLWGIVCGIGGDFFMPVLGAFAFCGFMSGVFSKFGKGGVISGMVIANAILVVYTNGAMVSVLSLAEVMVSAVIFAFLPQKTIAFTKDLLFSNESDKDGIIKIKNSIKARLNGVSCAFASLAHTLDKLSDKEKEAEIGEVAEIFDLAADKICKDCRKSAICWGKDFNSTYKSLFRLLEIMEERGTVSSSDVTDRFKDTCLNLPKLLSEINRQYELYRVNRIWKNKLTENRELIGEQLCGMSKIIESLSDEIENGEQSDNVSAEEILATLKSYGILPESISVTRDRNGKHMIKLEFRRQFATSNNRTPVFEALKSVLPYPIDLYETVVESGKTRIWEFSETERYAVESGFARAGTSDKNGDSCRFTGLGCGKYIAILSDGMGTGAKASRESGAIIELLENFIKAGFDSRLAVKLINSIMVVKSENAAFATLDICIIDLYSGNAEFIKTGAEPSFIIRRNIVETVCSSSLPMGVLAKIETSSSFRHVHSGDTIVMITDGVKGKHRDTEQIKQIIEKERACAPDMLAEEILRKVSEDCDDEKDDMTVITLKIKQKNELLHIA